jgi:DNA polymerase III subunit delta'
MYLFSRTLGLEEAKASLSHAIASHKFPHALLIHGPAGVGQLPMLLDLADILICEATDSRPCLKCSGCLGRKHNNLDNLVFVIPMEKKKKEKEKEKESEKSNSDGDADNIQADDLTELVKDFEHDPYGFTHTEKSAINVAQVRDLQSRLAFAEVSKRPRIVIMPWIETMAHEAANTLLKTLEEPPPNTYFLLSSDDRSSLLPTILSRCTQLAAFPMESDAWENCSPCMASVSRSNRFLLGYYLLRKDR